ncbi:peptidoglycan DD-metalloendopeptidase family protein [Pseudomonas sp. C27(2019)]|uniref:murein hydrolase activator EnvC family protein n=1 Tax=Pseudomonas sp. C27(2019) TaxID=2604941 RepID=UPI001244F694|nr:peptidoglycan DD-metalloendopeptidase family protein [Pseudomonas sp. C27(2019)]QEY60000.1 peptidoglycan DD-metalloendopeptidase family protein [Pseudomonas sp. C27(2019)]
MLRTFLFILLSCAFTVAVANDQRTQTKQELAQAAKDIAELKKQLGKIQQEKSSAEQALKKTETEIGDLEKQVNELQQQQKKTEDELSELNQQRKKLHSSRLEQQDLIAIQARAAYQAGQQEPLRLLLNQQQPEKFSRNLTYYQYIGQARQQQINTFNETLRQLSNISDQISLQQTKLAEQKTSLMSKQESLKTLRQQRQQKVATLTKQQRKESQSLKTRQADQVALNKVLKTIEATLARQAQEAERKRQKLLAEQQRQQAKQLLNSKTPTTAGKQPQNPVVSTAIIHQGGSFASVRGKLPWPVNGRLIAHFGSARGDTRSKWDGVLISSQPGTQVRAIHSGRVVFADWLRGAGLLVIVDHGDGYLSLYGHNQSLLSRPGDIVKTGQALSTVGNTGGRDQAALYFAIRQKGQPADPTQWCRTQG